MKLLSLTLMCAFICATTAAPTASDSIVPETGLLQVAIDARAADDAKNTVETMLAAGSDSSACGDLADSIIAEVKSAITRQEKVLDTVSDGSHCESEGQDVVEAAQKHLTQAQETKTSADTAASAAASAPVDMGTMSLSSLGNAECVNHQNDESVIAAKKTNDDAQAAATTAAAELTAAKTALTDAQEAQKVAIMACKCEAYKTFEAAYTAANTRSDEDLAAWKKGKHMKCVLAGTDPSSCSVGTPPDVTRRALAQGVSESCVDNVCPAGANSVSFPIQTGMGPAPQTSTGSPHCANCPVDVSGSCQEGYTFTPSLSGINGAWYRGAFAPMKINQDDLPFTLSWTASVQGDESHAAPNDAYVFMGLDYVNNNEQNSWYDCQMDFVGRCNMGIPNEIFTEYQQGCKTDNSILENSCSCGSGGNFEIKVAKDGTVTYHKDGTLCITSRAKATNFPMYVESAQYGVRAVLSKIMVTRG